MAFDAGAVVGKIILDDSQYKASSKNAVGTNKQIVKSFGAMGLAAGAASALIVAGFVKSIKAANEFQKAFSNVRTIVDETVVNTKKMQKELLNLDARLGSAKNLTDGLYQALSAGVEPAKAVQFVGEAAKFAKAALTDTFTAVDVMTTALNAYGLEASEAGRVSDVFFQTIKLGKITGQELASSLGKVIPTASKLGIEVESLGAAMATMTKQGVKSFEAVTQLQALFTEFIKPSNELSAALKEIGVESGAVFAQTKGLSGILEFLQDTTSGNVDKMGELFSNTRALKGALALTGIQAKNFSGALIEMQNAAGATDIAFAKQELTFETLNNQVNKLQIRIGNAFLPVLYQMTDALTGFTEMMEVVAPAMSILIDMIAKAFSPFVKGLGDNLKILTSAFGDVNLKIKTSTVVFNTLAPIIKTIGIGFAISMKVLKFFTTAIRDLIIITKEAIGTLVLFGKALFNPKKWKEVGDQIKDVGKSIGQMALNTLGSIGDVVNSTVIEFAGLVTESKGMANNWSKIWNEAIGEVNTSFDNLGDTVEEVSGGMSKRLMGGLRSMQSEAAKTTKTITDDMKAKWKEAALKILSIIGFVMGQIANIMTKSMAIVMNDLKNQMDKNLDDIDKWNDKKNQQIEDQRDLEIENNDIKFEEDSEKLAEQRELGLISDEEYNEQLRVLEQQKADNETAINQNKDDQLEIQRKKALVKTNAEKKKVFEAEKKAKISSIWISFAIGTVAAFAQSIAQLGPFAGLVMGGVLTAALLGLAIAQTSVVNSQQFIPAREKGGMAGGLTRINEAGGEIVSLPDGSQVIPNDISNRIAESSGGSGNVFNISFAGARIADDMSLKRITDHVLKRAAKMLRLA